MAKLEQLRQMKRVAYLYYERDLTQQEIAVKLGLSRPKVSRLLRDARREGIVRIAIVDALETVTDLSALIKKKFGLADAVVVPTSAAIPDMVRQLVGKAAATYLSDTMRPHMTLGVTWGITLYETVKALTGKRVSGAKVVQMTGGLGNTSPVLQSFDLARRIAEKFEGSSLLLHAPAVMGSAATRNALVADPSIRDTLKAARSADVALVGLDSLWRHTSLVTVDNLTPVDLASLDGAGAVGQIGFRFYDIHGAPCCAEIASRTIGITLDELKAIGTVIGIATSLDTVEAIFGGLKTGAIDVLICDESAADRLLLMKEELPTWPPDLASSVKLPAG